MVHGYLFMETRLMLLFALAVLTVCSDVEKTSLRKFNIENKCIITETIEGRVLQGEWLYGDEKMCKAQYELLVTEYKRKQYRCVEKK